MQLVIPSSLQCNGNYSLTQIANKNPIALCTRIFYQYHEQTVSNLQLTITIQV